MKKTLILTAILTLGLTSAVRASDGKTVYGDSCAKCHGDDGKGATKMGTKLGAKDYSLKATWADLTDAQASKAVTDGLKKDDKTLMKPFADLSADDVKAVVDYMKTLAK